MFAFSVLRFFARLGISPPVNRCFRCTRTTQPTQHHHNRARPLSPARMMDRHKIWYSYTSRSLLLLTFAPLLTPFSPLLMYTHTPNLQRHSPIHIAIAIAVYFPHPCAAFWGAGRMRFSLCMQYAARKSLTPSTISTSRIVGLASLFFSPSSSD